MYLSLALNSGLPARAQFLVFAPCTVFKRSPFIVGVPTPAPTGLFRTVRRLAVRSFGLFDTQATLESILLPRAQGAWV